MNANPIHELQTKHMAEVERQAQDGLRALARGDLEHARQLLYGIRSTAGYAAKHLGPDEESLGSYRPVNPPYPVPQRWMTGEDAADYADRSISGGL